MRETKFRARSEEAGHWYDGTNGMLVDTNDKELGQFWQLVENGMLLVATVGEYIGLLDKNGKECYHKDIIKRVGILYVVEWHNNLASWFLKPICGGWHGITKGDMALMCEKIGDIYSNPELVKET